MENHILTAGVATDALYNLLGPCGATSWFMGVVFPVFSLTPPALLAAMSVAVFTFLFYIHKTWNREPETGKSFFYLSGELLYALVSQVIAAGAATAFSIHLLQFLFTSCSYLSSVALDLSIGCCTLFSRFCAWKMYRVGER